MPGSRDGRPFAELDLQLSAKVAPLPTDSQAAVRVGSILGSKYLALYPGSSKHDIPQGGVIPLQNVRVQTDLGQAFHVFNHRVTSGIRGGVNQLGIAAAGRGEAVNESIGEVRRLLPPLQRVLGVLVSPRTDLAGFLRGAAATVGALSPVTAQLVGAVENGTITLRALNAARPDLGRTIEALPGTEAVGRRAFVAFMPLLGDASAIARELRPAAALLPGTSRTLSRSLALGTRAVRARTHGALDPLLTSFDQLANDPATAGTVGTLAGTIGSVGSTLKVLSAAQITCNTFALFARNGSSILSEGDAAGNWTNLLPILGTNELFQAPRPDPNLHLNFYPHETSSECEAGNEPYTPGQAIGNPPGSQGTGTELTAPPPDVVRRARAAGLWQPLPGAGR